MTKALGNTRSATGRSKPASGRWILGLVLSSIFTLAYFLAPSYVLAVLVTLALQWPSLNVAFLFAIPVLISVAVPPMASPWLLTKLAPMLDYFEYEQIIETRPIDARQEMRQGRNYILAAQPHGVLSMCGICSAVHAEKEFQGKIPTGVATALLSTPILKHVMGIFYLISASKSSITKQLKKEGIEGTVFLYVGGIAELFLCSEEEEVLFLSQRKGFIKLALQEGVDVIPIYLFGNTSVLSVIKTGLLASLSRRLQVSMTYFWGRWYLPIPRDEKLLYVGGQPLGLPQIDDPTQADIDTWHAKYCAEVKRLFDRYKERLPNYKHKVLKIV